MLTCAPRGEHDNVLTAGHDIEFYMKSGMLCTRVLRVVVNQITNQLALDSYTVYRSNPSCLSDPEAALGFEGILIPGTRACPRSFVGASVCLSNGH